MIAICDKGSIVKVTITVVKLDKTIIYCQLPSKKALFTLNIKCKRNHIARLSF